MNIIEAIKSGKQFKRTTSVTKFTGVGTSSDNHLVFMRSGLTAGLVSYNDLFAEYEIVEEKIEVTESEFNDAWFGMHDYFESSHENNAAFYYLKKELGFEE